MTGDINDDQATERGPEPNMSGSGASGSGDHAGYAGSAISGGEGYAVANHSSIGQMLWIGFYTTLLNALTLTLFRFWGRTQFRQRLWSDTLIDGEPIEYTGKGSELFFGFLLAIVVLGLPTLIFVFGAQLLFGPAGAGAIVGLLYLFIFVLIGMALFLARRYHLSRTRFRGLRFAQTGSVWGYGFAAFGYGLLTAVTLGWFAPLARINLSKRKWNNAYYGSEKIRFEGTKDARREPVYLSFATAWIGAAAIFIGWGLALGITAEGLDVDTVEENPAFIAQAILTLIPALLAYGIIASWHEAVMIRRIAKSIHIDGGTLTSRIGAVDILLLAITNTMLIVLTLGIGYMAAQMRRWRLIANEMSILGTIDFEAIQQSDAPLPSTGEGLVDGLDLTSDF